MLPQAGIPQPVVRLEPTRLPKFVGTMRDFYIWRKDWKSLQKQGQPPGSAEVKKIQLLNSVDEKICRDPRLSSYSSTDDICRVLQNRYGNKSTAMEIIRGLDRFLPLKL